MDGACFNPSRSATSAATARSASIESVAVGEISIAPAAASVIQRGILRSIPSGPRTVTGRSARREAETTSSSIPASGWNR
jgi:hypothetical protein